jgi:hypothetical protein
MPFVWPGHVMQADACCTQATVWSAMQDMHIVRQCVLPAHVMQAYSHCSQVIVWQKNLTQRHAC